MEAVTRLADRERIDLLASAAAGDEMAFRQIIATHHEDMRRVCMAMFGDPTIADEATQAAWLVAWKKIGDVRDEAHLRPWLVSVAAIEAKRVLRQHHRRAQVEVAFDVTREPGGIDPATGIAAIDLWEALARMDPDDRALLAMRYVAGFDSNELIAEIGDIWRFDNVDQLLAYAGVHPAERSSGRKGANPETSWHMSKAGNAHLRAAAYRLAVVGVTHNPVIRAHYERKRAAGKSKMNALGHCMSKALWDLEAGDGTALVPGPRFVLATAVREPQPEEGRLAPPVR
jgi:RNA polymerase sigma factor (sigma-70 family)